MNFEEPGGVVDSARQMPAEEENKERRESVENREGDTSPIYERFKLELTAVTELLEKGFVRPIGAPKENPWDEDAEIDVAGTTKVLESYGEAFAAAKKKEADVLSRLDLPDSKVMERHMKEGLLFTEQTLRGHDLLPADFDEKKRAVAALSVAFEPEGSGGEFIPDKEDPKIGLGGKMVRLYASHIRDVAKKLNREVSGDEAIDMVMTFHAAHEWGHYLNFTENVASMNPDDDGDQWFLRAEKNRDDVAWVADEGDRRSVFHEWICQTIGDQVLRAALEKKGFSAEEATKVAGLFTDDTMDIVGSYRALATWAGEHQTPGYKVTNAISFTASELRKAGREDLAERLGASFHFVGYCLKPLEISELRGILKGEDTSVFGEK